MSTAPRQTEAQRLAAAIESRTTTYGECREAAALLLRQDELLKQALEAMERGETKIRFAAITEIRALQGKQ